MTSETHLKEHQLTPINESSEALLDNDYLSFTQTNKFKYNYLDPNFLPTNKNSWQFFSPIIIPFTYHVSKEVYLVLPRTKLLEKLEKLERQ